MSLLVATGLSKAFGALDVFSGVDVRIEAGDRIGFVGANGAGKTTLLRILAGAEAPTAGDVARKRGLTVGLSAAGPAARGRRDAARRHAGRLRRAARPGRRADRAGAPPGRRREPEQRRLRRAAGRVRPGADRLRGGRRLQLRDAHPPGVGRAGLQRGRARQAAGAPERRRAHPRAAGPTPASASPICCCWTSRPTISTWKRSSGWRRRCCTGRARWSSSRTTATSWTRWRPASGT